MERQRGGTTFIGGPGELQIELDRRLIQEKIINIKKRLKKVQKRRNIQRKSRKPTKIEQVKENIKVRKKQEQQIKQRKENMNKRKTRTATNQITLVCTNWVRKGISPVQ